MLFMPRVTTFPLTPTDAKISTEKSFPFRTPLYHALHLEEPSEPPDLEDRLANDDANNEQVPPLDSAVGALGRVSVGALSQDNIRLLVLDGVKEIREFADWMVVSLCKNPDAHTDPEAAYLHSQGDPSRPRARRRRLCHGR